MVYVHQQPFNFKTIDLFYSPEDAANIKQHIRNKFGARESATVVELLDCDDSVIRDCAQFCLTRTIVCIRQKQWGFHRQILIKVF